jgi:hypothetical protein
MASLKRISLYPIVSKIRTMIFSAGNVTLKWSKNEWHTHPKGQVLIVLEVNGFYQEKAKLHSR